MLFGRVSRWGFVVPPVSPSDRNSLFHFVLVAIFSFLSLLPCSWVSPAAAESSSYEESLVTQAQEQKLSERPEWRAILHYRGDFFDLIDSQARTSLFDDPAYFLSPLGKNDPAAELTATIRAFFKTSPSGDEHAQCKFRGRFDWLSRELAIDRTRLPAEPCVRFVQWSESLAPHQLTLIYPGSYLNNPASMFGHTLLRIDTREQTEQTRMLAYAANYGAMTGETNGIAFAVNGLFGGYVGSFTIAPYYKLIEKYSDREHRDIWEYTLALSPEESQRLVALLWEHGATYSDYYFFEENCSFQLLFLFDYLRPEWRLAHQYPLWAIPSDTVKSIVRAPGLVGEVHFRPSAATILRHRLKHAKEENIALAEAIVEGTTPASEAEGSAEGAESLELAESALTFKIAKTKEEARRKLLAERAYEVLRARSTWSGSSTFPAIETPPIRPDQGHDSLRLAIGMGIEDDTLFSEQSLRLAYHDALDPAGGFVDGAEISIFSLESRYYEGEGFLLERFMPLEIRSLAARDTFIEPTSWALSLGIDRRHDGSEEGVTPAALRISPGISFRPIDDSLLWGLVRGSAEYSGVYEGNTALGLGAELGAYFDLSESNRILFEASASRYAVSEHFSEFEFSFGVTHRLRQNSALVLEVMRKGELDHNENTIATTLRTYW